jgi:hypothetical protein
MRTVIIILGGFVLLAACISAARLIGSNGAAKIGTATMVFVAVWFLAASINMWIGVEKAGYSVTEELPIFLLIFSLPAAVAGLIYWKFA